MTRTWLFTPLLCCLLGCLIGCSGDTRPLPADAGSTDARFGVDLALLDQTLDTAPTDSGADHATADAAPQASRSLVLVGGGAFPEAAYTRLIDLAGGKGKATIGVITAASIPESADLKAGTPEAYNSKANGQWYVAKLQSLGALKASWIPIDLDQIGSNADPTVLATIKAQRGFIFGAGDQARLILCLVLSTGQDSPALAAIRARFAAGAPVAGTSAGAAAAAAGPMLLGGESYEALLHGASTKADPQAPRKLVYHPQGLGFFGAGLIDTHVAERGRQGRLIRLAADTKQTLAFGLDEGTAMVVTGAGSAAAALEVLGEGGVSILDLAAATPKGSGSSWGLSGVKLSYLSSGDRYQLAARKLTPPAWKTPLAGREYYTSPLKPSTDIFSSPSNRSSGKRKNPRELVHVSTRLVDHQTAKSTTGSTYESGPAFKVTMTRVPKQTTGYQGYLNKVNHYAFTDLRLDIDQAATP